MAAAVDAQNLSQIVCILAPFFMAAAEATEIPRLSKIPGYATAADREFCPGVESKDQR